MSRKDGFLFLLVIFCHHVKNPKDKNKKKNMHADREKTTNKLALAKTIIFHVGQKTIILPALSVEQPQTSRL
jgi:hypothetical protein